MKKRNGDWNNKTKIICILLMIIFLTILSGCVGNNTTPSNPVQPDPKPAQNAISQAQSFLKDVQSDLSSALVPVNDAKSKGVETTSSDALISTLQNKLSNAGNTLQNAENEYNSQNYQQAKSDAEQSLSTIQEVLSQLSQIKQAVENDYKTTADKYKPRIIEAEKQYRIGEKYIESVKMIGGDASSQQANLNNVMPTLNNVKDAYKNNNFNGMSDQINKIIEISQQIQKELIDLYYNTLVLGATNKVASQVTSNEANIYISEATSLRTQKKYPEAVTSLNKALMTENQIDILNNINKLKQVVHNWGLESSFQMLDDKLNSIRLKIANGNFDDAKQEIESIKADITTVTDYIAKVKDTENIIDDTSTLSFWWAEKPDTKASKEKLNNAKTILVQGDYKSAADTSNTAIDLAKDERKTFWNKVKSDSFLGTLYDITNLVTGNTEKYEPKYIERPHFEWKNASDPIKIEFDKPIIDINNIHIEDPGAPISPTIPGTTPTTTPPKKPIYFELNPGNPTNCGTTCRQTTATLTNTGDDTAHNVKVSLNIVNNGGESVYSTQESVGDLPGGQSKSETVTINIDCGLLFSKCIGGNLPFTLKAEVIFDEGTQTFPDRQFSG